MTPDLAWAMLSQLFLGLVALIGGAFLLRGRVDKLTAEVQAGNDQVEEIGGKVDRIEVTLIDMQIKAAVHDERAVNIQKQVTDLRHRVTDIERFKEH